MNADPPTSSGTDSCQANNDNDAPKTTTQPEEIGDSSGILEQSLSGLDQTLPKDDVSQAKADNRQEDSTLNGSTATNSTRKGSFQSSAKRSGSFLSKLQSSTSSSSIGTNNNEDPSAATNLPSTLVNAFSSLTSSFTSSFTLGNFSNGANHTGTSNSATNNLTIETLSTSTGVSSQISDTREQILFKKATYERKNLINLTKLIIRDLISSSLSSGRTIDENHSAIHLNNYFTLIDRVLKHGLKQNLLTNKSASLWNALDNLPKYLTDKRLTSETVRSLAHTKTPDGRIKAWLRIAMMQKKLPEYLNELLANKNVLLKDIYHEWAFMLNDEAQVFAGLVIGVNVIDCNFFVKDDNFDAMDEVIDLSPYLKAANSFEEDEKQEASSTMAIDRGEQLENLTAVLDQKNYLEERSKHLESTITGLQNKIKLLEEQNSRLELDAKVNEVRIQKLQRGDPLSEKSSLVGNFPIPDALKNLMNTNSNDVKKMDHSSTRTATSNLRAEIVPNAQATLTNASTDAPSSELPTQECDDGEKLATLTYNNVVATDISTQQKQLSEDLERFQKLSSSQEKELMSLRERVSILETSYSGALDKLRAFERDLDIKTSMNKDKETTINIYEKDLREKQGQLESIRASLTESKRMNADLAERLDDTSAKLKDRLSTITNLQTSLDKWKIENKALATRLQDKQTALKSVNIELEKALASVKDLKQYNEKINDELRKERECGQSCSDTVETQTARINELTDRLRTVDSELDELRSNREILNEFKQRCQEYEQSLEEVGSQLRESRLEVENLKENSSMFLDSQWIDSKQVKNCFLCQQAFSITRRKHHCRLCGNVFCQTCSDNKMELASSSKPARVCDTCHFFLLDKFVKSSSLLASSASSEVA